MHPSLPLMSSLKAVVAEGPIFDDSHTHIVHEARGFAAVSCAVDRAFELVSNVPPNERFTHGCSMCQTVVLPANRTPDLNTFATGSMAPPPLPSYDFTVITGSNNPFPERLYRCTHGQRDAKHQPKKGQYPENSQHEGPQALDAGLRTLRHRLYAATRGQDLENGAAGRRREKHGR